VFVVFVCFLLAGWLAGLCVCVLATGLVNVMNKF
jgi:hypothetical protein